MMQKIKIGILFGGASREREVSFAGGRTVYDNLNKTLFEPVPLFVDSFGNFILLEWAFIYKGSIRDFYPPVESLPPSPNDFQVYAESLGNLSLQEQDTLIAKIGRRVEHSELSSLIEFAFLCLHGTAGEDGRIQGLLEYLGVPYSGSGILSSAIGINKAVQKQLMVNAGFASPVFLSLTRAEWLSKDKKSLFDKVKQQLKFPIVVKAANQGSSIGLSIVAQDNFEAFCSAINKSLFIQKLSKKQWTSLNEKEQVDLIRTLTDIREGIGIPLKADKVIYHPEELLQHIASYFKSSDEELTLEALDGESEVLLEEFIEGKEFSCIVIENEQGGAIALPPTEIIKGKEVFDYRSKYLPGLARKITPIDLPNELIEGIRQSCEKLFKALYFDVYARIDGFIRTDGKIFLNDPNTTSGMMPSSFFFHQAAEIGLNPSQFLTYIIRTSIAHRIDDTKNYIFLPPLLARLDAMLAASKSGGSQKLKIAVILGGYSSERHISVESGRNIYEKLASSEKYQPVPVFLTGNEKAHSLYQVPINVLLKDNADDIKEKVLNYSVHEVVKNIMTHCADITAKYADAGNVQKPRQIAYDQLASEVDGVFIALHGRPGEDGEVQGLLDKIKLPYNGSGAALSLLTINKFETNEVLRKNGFSVAKHTVVQKEDWKKDRNTFYEAIIGQFQFPFIAKPVDDGCSSAVKKIKNKEELSAFTELIFRDSEELDKNNAVVLNLKLKEEFPSKQSYLIEELITRGGAKHFLEITGGLLTHFDKNGAVTYEMFEASEALSEGDILSLEEKFLAGQGQNITPARYAKDPATRDAISATVKAELQRASQVLNIEGYARIDAFVRIFEDNRVEVLFIEVNSLPGMTPATCIFHQCAINGYKPYEFIDSILQYGFKKSGK